MITRPSSSLNICGIGRQGNVIYSSCIIEKNEILKNEMYEIFTTKGYAIVSAGVKLMSNNGPIEPSTLFTKSKSGDRVPLEYYLGDYSIEDDKDIDILPSPHSNCYPKDTISDLFFLEKMKNISLPFIIPRILFAELTWIKCKIEKYLNVQLAITVDNKTFPSEIELKEDNNSLCSLLAVTKFNESHSIKLLSEDNPWHPICDGLIIT